jgi:hypothetical protein
MRGRVRFRSEPSPNIQINCGQTILLIPSYEVVSQSEQVLLDVSYYESIFYSFAQGTVRGCERFKSEPNLDLLISFDKTILLNSSYEVLSQSELKALLICRNDGQKFLVLVKKH